MHGDVHVFWRTAVLAGTTGITEPDLLTIPDARGDADFLGVLLPDEPPPLQVVQNCAAFASVLVARAGQALWAVIRRG